MAGRLHTLYAAIVILFLLLPLLLAIPLSLTASPLMLFPPRGITTDWYGEFLASPTWNGPTFVSLALAALAATLATTIGGLAAWPLARRQFRGRDTLALLLGAPLVVPAISVAVGAYLVWANLGMLGSPLSLLATHVVLTSPLVLLVVGAALIEFDETYVHAARTLGAGRWTIIRRIIVPQILPSLIAAWLFAFIGSFDEVVITNFLVTAGQVPTLAVFVFNQIDSSASPAIAASAVVMATVAVVTAIALTNLDARRQRA